MQFRRRSAEDIPVKAIQAENLSRPARHRSGVLLMRTTSGRGPRGSRALLRAALTAVVLVLSFGGLAAPAAADHTLNCTPMSDDACKDLTPIVECLWSNGDGTSTIAWGYNNPSTHVIFIDFGGKNKLNPGADNQGQGTTFLPGMHHNSFTSTVNGTDRTWTLGNEKVSTSASTPACPTKPVPMIGSLRALLVGIALLLAIGLPVLALRPERTRVPA
jgi:hypothetical protein